VKDGDAAPGLSRALASSRRRRNHPTFLRSGDRVASLQEDMEELATDFYVGLIGTPQPREFDLNLGRIGYR
jgi:hypothetical protein